MERLEPVMVGISSLFTLAYGKLDGAHVSVPGGGGGVDKKVP